MIRRAFTMRLKPGASVEYRHHHDNVWPELVAEIERSGIASITTFQRDLDLFLVSEIKNAEAWDRLWNSEIHKRWAEVMEPLMHLRDDGIVDAGELTEMFHLETDGGRSTKSKGAAAARRASGIKARSAAGRASGKKTAGAARKKATAKTGARSKKKATGTRAGSGKKKRSARRK